MQITRKGFLKSIAGAAVGPGLFGRIPPALAEAKEASSPILKQARLADLEVYPFNMESKEVRRIALGNMSAANVLVRLRTADGLVGWGESSPFPPITGDSQATNVAAAKDLAEIVKGKDPFDLARVTTEMDAATRGQPGIKAAIEMAIWDICGKLAGRPVCCLLGNYRDSFENDITVYLDKPEIMAQKAQTIVDRGVRTVKVKLGETPDADLERLRAVREKVGKSIKLRIDANQAWTPNQAMRVLKALDQYDVQFCEQPVVYWDWDGLKFVRNNSPIPIMADESVHSPQDALEVARREAADMINIKLMKSGGILQAVRIAQIADAANMKCMMGCMSETRVALTAAAHVVSSQRNVLFADLDAFTEHKLDPVIGGMQMRGGIVRLPAAPGLGLDIDPAWFRSLRAA
jgi:L-alanine-DL-glutamate epimerase-like enolase superfamily enzyme